MADTKGVSATSDSKDKKISEVPHLEDVTGVEKIPVSAAGGEPRYVEVKQIVEKAVETVEDEGVEATKLKTPVMLWGNEFDGSGDVSGNLDNVGYINNIARIRSLGATAKINIDSVVNSPKDYVSINLDDSNRDLILQSKSRNVGIGIETPSEKLDVAGNIKASGTVSGTNITEIEGKLANKLESIRVNLTMSTSNSVTDMTGTKFTFDSDGTIKCYASNQSKEFIFSVNTDLIATRDYVDSVKTSILGSEALNESYDTLQEVAEWIESHSGEASEIISKQNAIEEWRNKISTLTLIYSVNPVYHADRCYLQQGRSSLLNASSSGVSIEFNAATSTTAGVMSAADKVKLDNAESKVEIVVANGETLTAEVGKYYRFDEPVNELAITLPNMEANTLMMKEGHFVAPLPNAEGVDAEGVEWQEAPKTLEAPHTLEAESDALVPLADTPMPIAEGDPTQVIATLELFFTTGDNPQVTINGNGAEVRYFAGFSIEPNTTYELNIMWNGKAWVVASAKVDE